MGFISPLTDEFSIFIVLAAICATLWTYCYVLVILKGIKDKVCGMPIEALAFNFAWEIMFGIVWLIIEPGENKQVYINILWGIFDIGILATFFIWGTTRGISSKLFKRYGIGCILFGFAIFIAFFINDIHHIEEIHAISAWLVNAVMSLMFIRMLWIRGTAGQSMKIAWSKALATFAVTIAFSLPSASLLLDINFTVIIVVGWICFAFDLTYIYLLSKALRSEK